MNKRILLKKFKKEMLSELNRLDSLTFLNVDFKNVHYTYFNKGVQFSFKEIPEILFCYSTDFYSDKVCYYFGEFNVLIDKFRPTRTYISEKDISLFINNVESVYKNIKYHFLNSRYSEKVTDLNNTYDVDSEFKHYFDVEKETYLKNIKQREIGMSILSESLLGKIDLKGVGFYDENVGSKDVFKSDNLYVILYVDKSINNGKTFETYYDILNDILSDISKTLKNSKYCFKFGFITDKVKDFNICHYKFI